MTTENLRQAARAEVTEMDGAIELPTNPSALIGFLIMRFGLGVIGFICMAVVWIDNRQTTSASIERMIRLEQQSIAVMERLADELQEHRRAKN